MNRIPFIKYLLIFASLFCFVSMLSNAQETIKIKAVGDIMLGSFTPVKIIPKDPAKTFSHLKDAFKNCDIAFGNLEGTFVDDNMKRCKCSDTLRKQNKCFEFGMPFYLVHVLKMINLNVVNRDNNHSMDYGKNSFDFTTDHLNSVNIDYINPRQFLVKNIKGIKIGFLAFGFAENSNKLSDIPKAKELITNAKKQCNLLYVSFHGGREGAKALYINDESENYLGANRGNLIQFSRAAIDAGADIVIGHGPHVLRSLELYNGKLIAYSLGNFLTYGNFSLRNPCNFTMILEAEIDKSNGNFISAKIHPYIQKKPGVPHPDKEENAIDLMKILLEKHKDSNLKINSKGEILKNFK
jgi:poly-gamma-glutamate capsule biosynthesis protein CapA/YwtB (metallophosphatase superfamily)